MSNAYDEALSTFALTAPTYGVGLANHGPMAVEALVHLGLDEKVSSFVEAYRPRLDTQQTQPHFVDPDWRVWLRAKLEGLDENVAAQAGHGLLRTAHAVRGLVRNGPATPSPNLLDELAAGVAYWEAERLALPTASEGKGTLAPSEWAAALPRLNPADVSDGLLTVTMARAAALPGFAESALALRPAQTPTETIDSAAIESARAYMRNTYFPNAFALLHGVTVSNMALVLLPHASEQSADRLVRSVITFVAAAISGFDSSTAQTRTPTAAERAEPDHALIGLRAADTLDDHTIKFADACVSLSERTGSSIPILAADQEIERSAGTPGDNPVD